MARNGFSSPEKQKEANDKYNKTEKGKKAGDKATAKYKANQYIDKFAGIKDLEILKGKINKKLRNGGNMKLLYVAKGQGTNPEIEKKSMDYTEEVEEIFLTILDKILRVKFNLSKKAVTEYFTADEDNFTEEELKDLKSICREKDGTINGNIYLNGIDDKYRFVDWFEEDRELIDAAYLREILGAYKKEIEKILSKEQLKKLKEIEEFIGPVADAGFKLNIK
ncbi:hypothetical protein ACDQ56_03580 [Fusobacterium animalis]|uniref:hypothetical protein n=1 Tax=Fusobacterium animalis TaxID=76859 RepID=UPI00355912D1